MKIRSIHVRHFKSLDNVEVGFSSGPQLLVGTNASGKSNIIDAARFLRDAVRDSLDHAISVRGGIDVLRQYSSTRPYKISFTVHFDQDISAITDPAIYELKIETTGSGNFRVEHEEASWHEAELFYNEEDEDFVEGDVVCKTFVRHSNGYILLDGDLQKRPAQPDELALGARSLYEPIAHPIASTLSNLRFSSLYPNTLRTPSRPATDRFLREDGENWASVLKSMRRTDRGKKAVLRIVEMMGLVFPTLQDVHVKTVGGYLVPQFLVRDTEGSKPHYFDPIHLSDGTLRVFGILLALYQYPPASFLAIEEPEQTVNPGVLGVLADAFMEVSSVTQLLVTTHSPSLVDYFSVEQIKVVTMNAGATRCRRIKASQIEAVKRKLATTGELMFLDGLHPEEDS